MAHLCRWEPIVARPEPRRPPEGALLATTQQQSTIATLTARIAALEQVIVKQNLQLTWGGAVDIVDTGSTPELSSSSGLPTLHEEVTVPDPQHLHVPHGTRPPSSRGSTPSTPKSGSSDDLVPSDANPALSRVDLEVQFAAAKMAQLTLAPPNEFVGAGTIFCAIHKVCTFAFVTDVPQVSENTDSSETSKVSNTRARAPDPPP